MCHTLTTAADANDLPLEFLTRLIWQGVGLAAAAYNAGPKRVQDWVARRGGLPQETQAYVRIVTGRSAEEWMAAKSSALNVMLQTACRVRRSRSFLQTAAPRHWPPRVNPRPCERCSSSGTLRRPTHSPLIINCREGTPQFSVLTSRSSSKITGKAPHGTESASGLTLARASKGCAPASASVPLSLTTVLGLPRSPTSRSSSRATRIPEIEVSPMNGSAHLVSGLIDAECNQIR